VKKALIIMAKEVRDFLRDKGDLAFSLLLPILIFGIFYGAFGGNVGFNGTAYVVNEDPGGKYSALLLQNLGSYKGLTIQMLSASDANDRLNRSNILLALFIPQGFSANLAADQPTQLTFKQRGNGGTEGEIVTSMVEGAADSISQVLILDRTTVQKILMLMVNQGTLSLWHSRQKKDRLFLTLFQYYYPSFSLARAQFYSAN